MGEVKKGLFVVLEGPDGCGKTSILSHLYDVLNAADEGVVRLREPGSTIAGEHVRDLLKDKSIEMQPLAQLLLFEAARADMIPMIQNSLNVGNMVLCDRFTLSTEVYQHYGFGLDLSTIELLNKLATSGLRPDLTLFITAPLATCAERCKAHEDCAQDRFDSKNRAFSRKIHNGYSEQIEKHRKNGDRIYVLDNEDRPIEEVVAEAYRVIQQVKAGTFDDAKAEEISFLEEASETSEEVQEPVSEETTTGSVEAPFERKEAWNPCGPLQEVLANFKVQSPEVKKEEPEIQKAPCSKTYRLGYSVGNKSADPNMFDLQSFTNAYRTLKAEDVDCVFFVKGSDEMDAVLQYCKAKYKGQSVTKPNVPCGTLKKLDIYPSGIVTVVVEAMKHPETDTLSTIHASHMDMGSLRMDRIVCMYTEKWAN